MPPEVGGVCAPAREERRRHGEVGELLLPPAEPIGSEIEQPGRLPVGEVRILHAQFGQRPTLDQRGKIVLDDLDRPSVDDDVMEGQQQLRPLLGPDQLSSDQRPATKIKRRAQRRRLTVDHLDRAAQVAGPVDPLHRLTVHFVERRPQRLVPGDQRLHGGGHPVVIDFGGQDDGARTTNDRPPRPNCSSSHSLVCDGEQLKTLTGPLTAGRLRWPMTR